jgi:AhpD family alkylhydroperoxidase
MQARMKNPAMILDGAQESIQGLIKAASRGGVAKETLELVHLRASQINGCSACVDGGVRGAKKAGMTDEKLGTVAAWREAPYFSDAERAALALAEAMTRLSDRSADAVSDELWDEVADHYDEPQLAALILWIATTNFFNRLNATVKEPAGATWG